MRDVFWDDDDFSSRAKEIVSLFPSLSFLQFGNIADVVEEDEASLGLWL